MLVFRQFDDPALSLDASVVTVGNFDGIHLGHQALVSQTVQEAQRRQVASVVVTFEPHPRKVLVPSQALRLILTTTDKLELLQNLGVDLVINQRFDASFAGVGAEEFVRRFMVGRLRAKKILVGRDLRFGHGREGNVEQLVKWAAQLPFEVSIVEPILVDGVRVSSSRIRELIEDGRVDEAQALLGRYHFISGTVIEGNRRGREIGFPTANIAAETEVLPSDGIYATLFHVDGVWWPSASSIGVNPTFGEGTHTLETHILDFDRDIYGKAIKLAFVKRIRNERKFVDVPSLVSQIEDDVELTRSILGRVSIKT
jgi:riboflavin kinase/FMN adenylyltransferase